MVMRRSLMDRLRLRGSPVRRGRIPSPSPGVGGGRYPTSDDDEL